jgi:hypothetical protein
LDLGVSDAAAVAVSVSNDRVAITTATNLISRIRRSLRIAKLRFCFAE